VRSVQFSKIRRRRSIVFWGLLQQTNKKLKTNIPKQTNRDHRGYPVSSMWKSLWQKETCSYVTVTPAGIWTASPTPSLPSQLGTWSDNAPHVPPLLPHPRLPCGACTSPPPFLPLTLIKHHLKTKKKLNHHFFTMTTPYDSSLHKKLWKENLPPPYAMFNPKFCWKKVLWAGTCMDSGWLRVERRACGCTTSWRAGSHYWT